MSAFDLKLGQEKYGSLNNFSESKVKRDGGGKFSESGGGGKQSTQQKKALSTFEKDVNDFNALVHESGGASPKLDAMKRNITKQKQELERSGIDNPMGSIKIAPTKRTPLSAEETLRRAVIADQRQAKSAQKWSK